MKKIKWLLFVVLIFCGTIMIILSGCIEDESSDTQLAAPIITIDEQANAIVWTHIQHTSNYTVNILSENDDFQIIIFESSYSLYEIAQSGTYSFSVRANAFQSGFPNHYLSSEWSSSLSYTLTQETLDGRQLQSPNITINDALVANWDAVEKAERYEYTVSHNYGYFQREWFTDDNSIKLADILTFFGGQYTLKVRAIYKNEKAWFYYSDWTETEFYYYNGKNDTPQISGVYLNGYVNYYGSSNRLALQWSAVTTGTGYIVSIDGVEQPRVNHAFLSVENLTAHKTYKFKVKSVGANTGYYFSYHQDSDWSDEFEYTITNAETPAKPFNNGSISWNIVDNVREYCVSINGNEYITKVSSLSFPFSRMIIGENIIKVKALGIIPDTDSDWSEELIYIAEAEQLNAPYDLSYSSGDIVRINWKASSGASYYIIDVGGVQYKTADADLLYILIELPRAYHTIKVKAVGEGIYLSSAYSASINIDNRLRLDIPHNLNIDENKMLTWDKVENATKYIIDILSDCDEFYWTFEVLSESVSLDFIVEPGAYLIRIRSIDDSGIYIRSNWGGIYYRIGE